MSSMDAKAVTARLEADKSFATLFGILRDYGDLPASVWLEGEQEHSRTYTEVTRVFRRCTSIETSACSHTARPL